jgi:hypothetical protein
LGEHLPYKQGVGSSSLSSSTIFYIAAGWSSLVARWAHNPKVDGSNPSPATNYIFGSVAQSVEQRTENPCVGGSIPSRATTNMLA